MQKITNCYSQLNGLTQKDVEFIDIYLGIDNPIFLDFNKIYQSNCLIGKQLEGYLKSYMLNLGRNINYSNNNDVIKLLEGIHESNETYLGLSKATNKLPKGNSIGKELKEVIFNNFPIWRKSLMQNPIIDSFQYGIKNIGPDRISDIVISICKEGLINFTINQCKKHKIPLTQSFLLKYYDLNSNAWCYKSFLLPEYRGKAVILIPKLFMSDYSSYNNNFNRFIRYSFEKYFSTSNKFIEVVREDGNRKTPLLRKEFDSVLKKLNLSHKDISIEAFSEIENRTMIEIIGDIRSICKPLSDYELMSIIDEVLIKKNIA